MATVAANQKTIGWRIQKGKQEIKQMAHDFVENMCSSLSAWILVHFWCPIMEETFVTLKGAQHQITTRFM